MSFSSFRARATPIHITSARTSDELLSKRQISDIQQEISMTFSIQKANFWKRFSAWMVDATLVVLLAIAIAIPVLEILQFNRFSQELASIQETYKIEIEAQHSIELDITTEEYEALSPNDKIAYDNASNAFNELLSADTNFMQLRADRITVILTTTGISLFLGVLLAHFILPLILKNGQTLGKKTFGLAVIRSNGVKITSSQLFIRSIIGLFAIETMALAFLICIFPVGTIAAILLLALQIGVMIKTPHNASIHDLLADTAVVEFLSQHIFETEDERVAFVARQEREAMEAQKDA